MNQKILEIIKEMEVSTHYSNVDRAVYRLTPEAKVKRQIVSISDNNESAYKEGLISEQEYNRVRMDLKRIKGMLIDAKDEGKEIGEVNVFKIIYGSYIL